MIDEIEEVPCKLVVQIMNRCGNLNPMSLKGRCCVVVEEMPILELLEIESVFDDKTAVLKCWLCQIVQTATTDISPSSFDLLIRRHGNHAILKARMSKDNRVVFLYPQ